jgi:hypothetical protein
LGFHIPASGLSRLSKCYNLQLGDEKNFSHWSVPRQDFRLWPPTGAIMRSMSRSKAVLSALAALTLGGCGSSSSALRDFLEVAPAALEVAAQAVELDDAINGQPSRSIPSGAPAAAAATRSAGGQPNASGAYKPAGYSQRGAFDDCARMYAMAGNSTGVAECQRRAANMGSLR